MKYYSQASLLLLGSTVAFQNGGAYHANGIRASNLIRSEQSMRSHAPSSRSWLRAATDAPVASDDTDMAAEPVAPKKSSVDVSSFSVGQEFDGKLVSAKNFGVFVDIGG